MPGLKKGLHCEAVIKKEKLFGSSGYCMKPPRYVGNNSVTKEPFFACEEHLTVLKKGYFRDIRPIAEL